MTSLDAFPHPLLVGDIGGTNARFAVAPEPGAAPVPVAQTRTVDHSTGEAALGAALDRAPGPRPRSAVLCVAGPVLARAARLTNASWAFDGPALAEGLRLDQGLLLNDFEAAALSLPVVGAEDAVAIGPAVPTGRGPRIILGPGTGLGVAALAEAGGQIVALPGEAGHVGFGPGDAEEEAFWPHLERVCGRITPEAILSGPGLANLHRALAAATGRTPTAHEPADIARQALTGACPLCRETAERFLSILARFSGDMGIIFGATGGVFLRGGVITSLAPLIEPARFYAAFTDKAPVRELAEALPLYRLASDEIVLRGMAAIGAWPGRFALDWPARLWRT